MIKKEHKKTIISIIKKYIPDGKIYLFGSRAKSRHHPGSDIDLAVDTPQKIDRHVICSIKEEIEKANIPFFVDIVDLQRADSALKSQIKKDHEEWKN